MTLTGALCHTLLAATGFTNKSLRALITGLLGSDYHPGQMTYDLRRLRLAGLIPGQPHSTRYTVTDDGIRIAIFYNKLYHRLLVPLTAANQPQAPSAYAPHCPQSPDTSTLAPPTPACDDPGET